MPHLFNIHPMGLPGRRPVMRSAIAGAAVLLLASWGSSGALAQQATSAAPDAASLAAPSPATSASTRPPPAGALTRAQVVAELQCARASGELDAAMLRSYGLPASGAVTMRAAGDGSCGASGGEAVTARSPAAAAAR